MFFPFKPPSRAKGGFPQEDRFFLPPPFFQSEFPPFPPPSFLRRGPFFLFLPRASCEDGYLPLHSHGFFFPFFLSFFIPQNRLSQRVLFPSPEYQVRIFLLCFVRTPALSLPPSGRPLLAPGPFKGTILLFTVSLWCIVRSPGLLLRAPHLFPLLVRPPLLEIVPYLSAQKGFPLPVPLPLPPEGFSLSPARVRGPLPSSWWNPPARAAFWLGSTSFFGGHKPFPCLDFTGFSRFFFFPAPLPQSIFSFGKWIPRSCI